MSIIEAWLCLASCRRDADMPHLLARSDHAREIVSGWMGEPSILENTRSLSFSGFPSRSLSVAVFSRYSLNTWVATGDNATVRRPLALLGGRKMKAPSRSRCIERDTDIWQSSRSISDHRSASTSERRRPVKSIVWYRWEYGVCLAASRNACISPSLHFRLRMECSGDEEKSTGITLVDLVFSSGNSLTNNGASYSCLASLN